MPLFDRGKPNLPDTGTYAQEQSGEGNRFLLVDNPLSHLYVVPISGSSPTEIVRYLIAEQKKKFGYTILDQQAQKILVRNCKLLLKKYDPEIVVRTVAYCVIIAEHPFSFAFVAKHIGKVNQRVKGVCQ